MNHELDVDVIFGDRDLVINTRTDILKAPEGTDPEIAKAIFLEAIKNMQEDHR
nr:MAG TPA: hypothetical protein [Siphovirus LN-2020-2]